MNREIVALEAHALSNRLQRKELTAAEATRAYLAQIEQREPDIGAYITVTAEIALAQAKQADALRAKSEPLTPLAGIPAAIKDNICTNGVLTTCASKMLANFIPPYDAAVMEQLNRCHTITLGKVNLDEFAMGSSTESSFFHATHNPIDFTRVPGGSSGGSAAAVAAGEAAFSLGTDTGGSIRQPASFCGIVGMKPTYGRVSRYGLVGFAPSLDQIGPMTRSVLDNAFVLNSIAGHDPRDATSANRPQEDFTALIGQEVKGLRIGIPAHDILDVCSQEVRQAFSNAVRTLEEQGAHIIEAALPHWRYAMAVYRVVACAEASSNLARFDGVRYGLCPRQNANADMLCKAVRSEGFGHEVKKRILFGGLVLGPTYRSYYEKAVTARTFIKNDFQRTFRVCDMMLTPTVAQTAFKLSETSTERIPDDSFTVPVNLAGLPALSLPFGCDRHKLPIGVQLIGKNFGEADLYRTAYVLEQVNKGGRNHA